MKDFFEQILDLIGFSIFFLVILPITLIHKASKKLYNVNRQRSSKSKNVFATMFFSVWARVGYLLVMLTCYSILVSLLYMIFNLPVPEFVTNMFPDVSFLSGAEKETVEATKEVTESKSWWSYFVTPFIILVLGLMFIGTSNPNDGLAVFIILAFTFIFVFLISAFVGVLRLIF
jgi:hypothetical protein